MLIVLWFPAEKKPKLSSFLSHNAQKQTNSHSQFHLFYASMEKCLDLFTSLCVQFFLLSDIRDLASKQDCKQSENNIFSLYWRFLRDAKKKFHFFQLKNERTNEMGIMTDEKEKIPYSLNNKVPFEISAEACKNSNVSHTLY